MSAPPELPPLVSAALSLSGRRGFVSSTRNETGRLLATLAASRTGLLGELGTGCGVGSAWLRSGAGESTRIVTAESDPQLAQAVEQAIAFDMQPGNSWDAAKDDPDSHASLGKRNKVRLWQLLPIKPLL